MSTDIVKRCEGVKELDFLKLNEMVRFDGDIITNPPYKYALEFVDMALKYVNFWNKVAMLLRIQFLEGIKRADFFEKHPPRTVYIFKKRARCAMNGDFESYKSPAMSLAWFVWVKGFRGSPSIEWL